MVRHRPWRGGSGQAASPSPCWVCGRTVAGLASAVAAVGRALLAQVINPVSGGVRHLVQPGVAVGGEGVSQAWW
jgi:hypothetical protein